MSHLFATLVDSRWTMDGMDGISAKYVEQF